MRLRVDKIVTRFGNPIPLAVRLKRDIRTLCSNLGLKLAKNELVDIDVAECQHCLDDIGNH